MLKIGMCDDNIHGITNISKILESEIINQNLDAEITIIFVVIDVEIMIHPRWMI